MYFIPLNKSQAKRHVNKAESEGRAVNITLSPCNIHPGYTRVAAATYKVETVRDFLEKAEMFARTNCNPINGKYPHYYLETSF